MPVRTYHQKENTAVLRPSRQPRPWKSQSESCGRRWKFWWPLPSGGKCSLPLMLPPVFVQTHPAQDNRPLHLYQCANRHGHQSNCGFWRCSRMPFCKYRLPYLSFPLHSELQAYREQEWKLLCSFQLRFQLVVPDAEFPCQGRQWSVPLHHRSWNLPHWARRLHFACYQENHVLYPKPSFSFLWVL